MTVKNIDCTSFFLDSTLSIPIKAKGTFGTGSSLFSIEQQSNSALSAIENAVDNLNDGFKYSFNSFENDALMITQILTSGRSRYYVIKILDTDEILITDSRIELKSDATNAVKGVSTLLVFPYHLLAEQSFKSAFANSTMIYDTVYTIKTTKSADDFYNFYSSTGKYLLEKSDSGFSITDDYGSGYSAIVFKFTQIDDSLTLSVQMI